MMETTRQIYWNIGYIEPILMYVFALISIIILVYGFYKRFKVYKKGKPLNRTDNCYIRIKHFITNTLFQIKVLSNSNVGIYHAIFFWAFLMLFIGTSLIFLQVDILEPLFGITFLKGAFYQLFSILLDVAGFLAFLTLLILAIRRFIVKPKGLETKRDDYFVHFLLLFILLTGFIVEGFRIQAEQLNKAMSYTMSYKIEDWGPQKILDFLGYYFVGGPYFSPVGLFFAIIMPIKNYVTLTTLHKLFWWLHMLSALTFIAIIPFIKLKHLFLTPINYFFKDLSDKGKLITLNLEDETVENYGVTNVEDLYWKDIFDSDACTKCKRCQDNCPAYNTEKPLSPMKVINQIEDAAFKVIDVPLKDTIGYDAIWSCTTCKACEEVCPAEIEHIRKIVDIRRALALMEGKFPADEVVTAIKNVEVNGNPLGFGFADRGKWAEALNVSILSEDSNVDIMYFVGCYGSFDARNIKVAKSFIEICKIAGLKVGILGSEEKCCGEPVRKWGNEYIYQMIAVNNIETINKYNVKKIVTTCPHCFNTLSKEYRDLGFNVPVIFYTVLLYELLHEKKISLKKEDFSCTYHDSCYVGRYNNIFEPQRDIINMSGATLVEMEKNRGKSFCCGGGGGRILADEKIGKKISVERLEEALSTKAPYLISNCPFCLTMFEDAIKMSNADKIISSKDIAELMLERLI